MNGVKQQTLARFSSHGVAIAVTSDGSLSLGDLELFLPPRRTPLTGGRVRRSFHLAQAVMPDGRRVFSLGSGARTLFRGTSLSRTLGALEWETCLYVAQSARDRIFVHAGAVEWNGRAILLPGRSFSGKSTLVAELVRAGCGYLSDEYAVLDSNGECHSHPRPLKLRVTDGIERRRAEELGGYVHEKPLPVGLVLMTQFAEGARWQPRQLSPGAAVLALLQNTVAARSRADEVLGVLRAAVGRSEALEGMRGDAAEVARMLLSSHGGEHAGTAASRGEPGAFTEVTG